MGKLPTLPRSSDLSYTKNKPLELRSLCKKLPVKQKIIIVENIFKYQQAQKKK